LGDSVTLTNLTQYEKGVTYKWTLTPSTGFSYINNTKDTSRNPKLRFTVAGSYSVKLSATIGASTKDTTKTNYFTVTVVPTPLRPDFEASQTSVFTSDTIQLFNLTQTGTDTIKYQWTITPIGTSATYVKGTSNTSISPWVTFSQKGVYTVKLRATRGLAFKDTTKVNYINVADAPPPTADFYCPNQNLNTGDTAMVTNQSAQAPGLRYHWTITPATGWTLVGGTNDTSRDLMVVFSTPGTYGLKLENLLNSGSTVNDRPDFFTVSAPLATRSVHASTLSAYPNPATSSVSVVGLHSPSATWAWIDALGHTTPVSAQTDGTALVVQTEGLANGLYILKGQDNGVQVMVRVQVQR
jgi:PKD repeat protein